MAIGSPLRCRWRRLRITEAKGVTPIPAPIRTIRFEEIDPASALGNPEEVRVFDKLLDLSNRLFNQAEPPNS